MTIMSLKTTAVQFVRFGVVGVLNTALTLMIIYTLMYVHTNPYVANAVGYACGVAMSFTLNRRWTFRSNQRPDLLLVGRFLVAMGCAYFANLATLYAGIRAGASPYVAQLLGMPVYTLCFFLVSKFFVFRKSGDT
jgi:putative flippase GtrA